MQHIKMVQSKKKQEIPVVFLYCFPVSFSHFVSRQKTQTYHGALVMRHDMAHQIFPAL